MSSSLCCLLAEGMLRNMFASLSIDPFDEDSKCYEAVMFIDELFLNSLDDDHFSRVRCALFLTH
jgi:hypothetical protein